MNVGDHVRRHPRYALAVVGYLTFVVVASVLLAFPLLRRQVVELLPHSARPIQFVRDCGVYQGTPDPWQVECDWERTHDVLPLGSPLPPMPCDALGPVIADLSVPQARTIGQYVGAFASIAPKYDTGFPVRLVVFEPGWFDNPAWTYAKPFISAPADVRIICVEVAGERNIYLMPTGTPY